MSKKIAAVAAAAPVANYTLVWRRDHPKDRASFCVEGCKGIVVFDKQIFASGKAPKTIVVNVELAQPKPEPVKVAAKADAAAK